MQTNSLLRKALIQQMMTLSTIRDKQYDIYGRCFVSVDDLNKGIQLILTALDSEPDFEKVYPRAMKLMTENKPFLVVAEDESYYMRVYNLIRDSEIAKETWTLEDEKHYQDAQREANLKAFMRTYMQKM